MASSIHMTYDKNPPSNQDHKNKKVVPYLGVVLWAGLLLSVGGIIWVLSYLFPGNFSANGSNHLEILRLLAILALVASGLLFIRRIRFGEVFRNIFIWAGILATLAIIYTYRAELAQVFDRISSEFLPGHAITSAPNTSVLTAHVDGHYYVYGKTNGVRVRFLVDTGASDIVLTPEDASRIGVDLKKLRYTQKYQTANGIGLGAPYRLDTLSVGNFDFDNIRVSVNQSSGGVSLLGMSFLERLRSYEFRGGKLYLQR